MFDLQDEDVWLLDGFTGFNTLASKWEDQPGSNADSVAYVPLHDAAFTYFLSMTDRRIVGVFDLGSTINSMYCGLFDPHMTETEYPYPQVIMGCLVGPQKYTYNNAVYAGLPNPATSNTNLSGPGWIRLPGGTIDSIVNGIVTTGIGAIDDHISIQPVGHQYNVTPSGAAAWYTPSLAKSWQAIVRVQDTDLSTQEHIRRFSDVYTLWPLILSDNENNNRLLGQLEECYWVDNFDGNLTNGDRIWVDGDAYRIFQNCKKTNKSNYFVVKEA